MFAQRLGSPPATVQTRLGTIQVPRLFTQSNANRLRWHTASAQIGYREDAEVRESRRPLFSGQLHVARIYSGVRTAYEQSSLGLELILNPTRFVRYQGYVRNVGDPPSIWELGPPRLARTNPGSMGEDPLDENDNVLSTPRMERIGCPDAWPMHVGRYWTGVTELFSAVFERLADDTGCELHHASRCLVRTVETYWEFSAPDALHLIRQLEPHLLTHVANTLRHQYFSVRSVQNSLSIRLQIGEGIYLKVYAKTRTRIRFEVQQDLHKSRFRNRSGSFSILPNVLARCAERAAAIVNAAFNHLAFSHAAELQNSAYALIHQIVQNCAFEEGEAVLSILVNHGGRIALGRRDPLRQSVRRLVSAGILRRTVRYRDTFVVAPSYGTAIAQLRA